MRWEPDENLDANSRCKQNGETDRIGGRWSLRVRYMEAGHDRYGAFPAEGLSRCAASGLSGYSG